MVTTLTSHTTDVDTKNIFGLFHPTIDFKTLLNELNLLGYGSDNMHVIMSEHTRNRYFHADIENDVSVDIRDKSSEGFTTGSVTGGIIGAIIGGLTLTGSLIVPGSQILLLGPAVGAISGALAGAAAGGIIGALIGMGIPEVEAKFFTDAVDKEEQVLLVVNARKDDVNEVQDLFKRFNAKKTTITG